MSKTSKRSMGSRVLLAGLMTLLFTVEVLVFFVLLPYEDSLGLVITFLIFASIIDFIVIKAIRKYENNRKIKGEGNGTE